MQERAAQARPDVQEVVAGAQAPAVLRHRGQHPAHARPGEGAVQAFDTFPAAEAFLDEWEREREKRGGRETVRRRGGKKERFGGEVETPTKGKSRRNKRSFLF